MSTPHLPWYEFARTYEGVAEVKGPQHNKTILHLLDAADGKLDGKNLQGIRDDETPWCATFVSAVLELSGIVSARSAWARSYLKWGQPLTGPSEGAIAVLERGPTSGHVAFVVGRSKGGDLILFGGNQGDMVKDSKFDMQRVIGFRWPPGYALPKLQKFLELPLRVVVGAKSKNEI